MVGEWLWNNKNSYNGLSFMPEDLGSYKQTPFETTDVSTYNSLTKSLSKINVADIIELSDNTNLMDQVACANGACEIS